MPKNFFTFSRFTLFVALCISAIAAWYSVIGLTAIFAGAVIPIIIMGGILEIAKITTTVWLHRYWDRAGYAIRIYLTTAVIALACLTSMGIFGLLSKAHLEQGVVSGDVVAQVSLFDEKIKVAKENIDANRKALKQLDEAVDQVMARSSTEQGADKAVQIRRQQAKERTRLLQEIEAEQKKISKFNEERAPIAAQLRKVEAEVGPIKYIAALIYGDNPDTSTLERAVRWVIILIVVVFDPLAIILILAANNSLKWEKENKEIKQDNVIPAEEPIIETNTINVNQEEKHPAENMTPWPTEWTEHTEEDKKVESVSESTIAKKDYSQHNYKTNYTLSSPNLNLQSTQTENSTTEESKAQEEVVTPVDSFIETEGVTTKAEVHSTDENYVVHNDKQMSIQAFKELYPNLVVEGPIKNDILFGNKFPTVAKIGDLYTRVDVNPHRTYKFNGARWLQIDRKENTSYLQNLAYLQFLISKLDSGEYDPELLTPSEEEEISDYLKRTT